MKNERKINILIVSLIIAIIVIVGLILYSVGNIKISLDKDVQVLAVIGIILIVMALIFAGRVRSINMDSHHKVQALALVGLTAIAITSLTVALNKTDLTSFIAVASAAAGGIAGFIAHKTIQDNKTVLPPLKNESVTLGNTLKLILGGMSTSGYALTYTKESSPQLPESAKLNPISGEFTWKPETVDDVGEYNVTFTVTDTQGGTDSRTMKIKVEPKEGKVETKAIEDNKPVLSPLKDEYIKSGVPFELTLKGISTAGYALTYTMSSSPQLPESAKLDPISGKFTWKPEEVKEYAVTFTVTDTQGGTDSKTMKIKVEPK